MKVSGVIAAASLAASATAQSIQSKPFHLVLSSSDKSINGKQINACHSGAAIESLCLDSKGASLYYNTTKGEQATIKGYTPPGTLVYNLPVNGNGQTESESMVFTIDPATNVGLPLFEPSYDSTAVSFDKNNKMVLISYLNDKVTPPNGTQPFVLDRWYACETYYTSYTYQNLAWVYGSGSPQNPSCKKVEVYRKFI